MRRKDIPLPENTLAVMSSAAGGSVLKLGDRLLVPTGNDEDLRQEPEQLGVESE